MEKKKCQKVSSIPLSCQELCYGEQLLGMDVCLSGEYIRPFVPHPPVFPFSGPAKFNVSIKPGKTPARKIQFKVRNHSAACNYVREF